LNRLFLKTDILEDLLFGELELIVLFSQSPT